MPSRGPRYGDGARGDERNPVRAYELSHAKEEARAVLEGGEVGHDGEVEGPLAHVELARRKLADDDPLRRAMRLLPRAGRVGVVDVNRSRAERDEPCVEPERRVSDHDDPPSRRERLGVDAEGVGDGDVGFGHRGVSSGFTGGNAPPEPGGGDGRADPACYIPPREQRSASLPAGSAGAPAARPASLHRR